MDDEWQIPAETVRKHRRLPPAGYIVGLLLLALTFGFWLWTMRSAQPDVAYIPYRYAVNLSGGLGLVYNSGERVWSAVGPLYVLLLAAAHPFGADLPTMGAVLNVLAISWGAWTLYKLVSEAEGPLTQEFPRSGDELVRRKLGLGWGILAAVLYAFSPPLWLGLGLEVNPALALVLWAFYVAGKGYVDVAGAAVGLASLFRPESALAVLPILATAWPVREHRSRTIRATLLALTPPVVLAGWTWLAYGVPLSHALLARAAQASIGTSVAFTSGLWGMVIGIGRQSPTYWLIAPAAMAGLLAGWKRRPWVIWVSAWALLHMVAYLLLGFPAAPWYYGPLGPAIASLSAFGLGWLYNWLRHGKAARPLIVTGVILGLSPVATLWSFWAVLGGVMQTYGSLALPPTDGPLRREVGHWLEVHTPPSATVGLLGAGRIGFYSERRIIDGEGFLQPSLTASLARRDVYSWIPTYMPDYLVLPAPDGESPVVHGLSLGEDAWFAASYRPVTAFTDPRSVSGPLVIYERAVTPGEWVRMVVDEDMGEGLRLVEAATDSFDLADAQPMRVWLRWSLSSRPTSALLIEVSVIDRIGRSVGTGTRLMDTSAWRAGEFFTCHTLVTMRGLVPGAYALRVSVSDEWGAILGAPTVGKLRVPLNIPAALPGDAQTSTAVFITSDGSIRLRGYRVLPRDHTLLLDLFWQAGDPPGGDYTVVIRLLDGDGEVYAEVEGRPRQDSYPTDIWSSGEFVPDGYTLDVPDSIRAGAYILAVGWRPTGGGDLLPVAYRDTDSVALARIVVEPDGGLQIWPVD